MRAAIGFSLVIVEAVQGLPSAWCALHMLPLAYSRCCFRNKQRSVPSISFASSTLTFIRALLRILYYEILTLFLDFDGILICQSESLKCPTETRIRRVGLLSQRHFGFLCFMPVPELADSKQSQRYRGPVLCYEKHNDSGRYNIPSPRKHRMHNSRFWSKCHLYRGRASWRRNTQRRSFCNINPHHAYSR